MAVLVFLLTVRFFVSNQKNLENLLPQTKRKRKAFKVGLDRDGFIVPATIEESKPATYTSYQNFESNEETRNEIKELRGMLQLQQLELTRAIKKMEESGASSHRDGYDEEDDYDQEFVEERSSLTTSAEVEELHQLLERRETELRELRQQDDLNKKLQGHFEEVQSGYEELQQKVHKMEQQAWQAAEMAIKVDSLEQANEQFERTVLKKEERMRELTVENSRLHEVLNQTEDKLSEANLQRQQLQKKVQFLEEINSDIQQMSDANRKLKNELRRVAELESMLNLITEERDALLKRRTPKF